MSSAVVRMYSSGGNIICRKGKAYLEAFFCFLGAQKKLWGSCWFVMQKFFYIHSGEEEEEGKQCSQKDPTGMFRYFNSSHQNIPVLVGLRIFEVYQEKLLLFWSGIYTVEFCTVKCTRKRTQPPIPGSETRGRMHTKLPSHIRYSSIPEFHERKPFSRNYFRNRPKNIINLQNAQKLIFPHSGNDIIGRSAFPVG